MPNQPAHVLFVDEYVQFFISNKIESPRCTPFNIEDAIEFFRNMDEFRDNIDLQDSISHVFDQNGKSYLAKTFDNSEHLQKVMGMSNYWQKKMAKPESNELGR
ncbi:hypothetical protein [Agrobacterium vitis]|uniref:hypothetical protein n=1 Tax=Agrobacterium vitis TaxID=373 RepID=UPI003D2C3BA7